MTLITIKIEPTDDGFKATPGNLPDGFDNPEDFAGYHSNPRLAVRAMLAELLAAGIHSKVRKA